MRFSLFLAEARHELHVAMGAGRFTSVTSEHEKLINNVFSQPAHHHYIFVMGPSTKEKTTEKDPFTVHEKIEHLKKLYPDKADSFIPGDQEYTRSPNMAMSWLYHRHKTDAKKINLSIVAGTGEKGIKGKAVGGSLESYKDIVDRLNETRYPPRVNAEGKTENDYRFKYHKVNFVPNPRGTISGSFVRSAARELDHNKKEDVLKFKKLLHSKTDFETAREMMKTIQERGKNK